MTATGREPYVVRATWDDEAAAWVATSDDIPGLVTEADTLEELRKKLHAMVPEMLALNGVLPPAAAASAPFKVITERPEKPGAAE